MIFYCSQLEFQNYNAAIDNAEAAREWFVYFRIMNWRINTPGYRFIKGNSSKKEIWKEELQALQVWRSLNIQKFSTLGAKEMYSDFSVKSESLQFLITNVVILNQNVLYLFSPRWEYIIGLHQGVSIWSV